MAEVDYQIKRSPRAKNVRLKVMPGEGLTVFIPASFDETGIPPILKRKKVWIDDALAQAERTNQFLEKRPVTHRPERLHLRAIGELWKTAYNDDSQNKSVHITECRRTLNIEGADLTVENVVPELRHWLRSKVWETLAPQAVAIAEKRGFEINRIFVKNQRTRWASCSSLRNLSLNQKLLFLRPELVRYVLIHELCHTVHMNHSGDFWRLVEAHEPQFRILDRELREGWKRIPQFLF